MVFEPVSQVFSEANVVATGIGRAFDHLDVMELPHGWRARRSLQRGLTSPASLSELRSVNFAGRSSFSAALQTKTGGSDGTRTRNNQIDSLGL